MLQEQVKPHQSGIKLVIDNFEILLFALASHLWNKLVTNSKSKYNILTSEVSDKRLQLGDYCNDYC